MPDEVGNEIILSLPRISRRGSPPTLTFAKSSMLSLGVPEANLRAPLELLTELYLNQGRPQSELASIFGVQRQTVTRWLDRLGIQHRDQGDAVSMALNKYQSHPFEGSDQERAYLLGLRAGDLHAQAHGRKFRISVGTTHPSMMRLFQDSFSKYGQVRRYPKFNEVSVTIGAYTATWTHHSAFCCTSRGSFLDGY